MGEPMPFERLHTLQNLLSMYEYRPEDVCVNEAIANAVDAFAQNSVKNKKIEISFDKTTQYGYIIFHNNAPPMTEDQFAQKYHTVSFSFKRKGVGIGFAGVGAKLFLAAPEGGEIITITGESNNKFLASKMYRTEKDLEYITSLKYPIETVLGKNKIPHKYGTTYRVRLSLPAYKYLKERIVDIMQYWWDYALLTKQFEVNVEGKKIEPWIPKGNHQFRKIVQWNKQQISCRFWISDEEIPEENRHIVYTVFGKRIKNDHLDFAVQVKGDYGKKVFCIADVTTLAKHLTSNKENFERIPAVGACTNKVKEVFWQFLKEQGLLRQGSDSKTIDQNIINDLTKKLDKLLQTKEFMDLNPFLKRKQQDVTIPDLEGGTKMSFDKGTQKVPGIGGRGNGGSEIDILGPNEGKGGIIDETGLQAGSTKQRKASGIQIITQEWPDQKEEAWVDLGAGGIVINTAHDFWKKISINPSLKDFNVNRILIEALIKFKSGELEWDPKKTLEQFRDLLHATWV